MSTSIQRLVLINARTLIADPQHWTRGTLARSREGGEVSWADRSAHRWCAMGAIYRAAIDLLGDANKAAAVGSDVVRSTIPPGVSQLLAISIILGKLWGAQSDGIVKRTPFC